MAWSVSCKNESDTSAFVDCKNRKETYGCFRHYISGKQARILKGKTKGCFLPETEGAFLIFVLFLLSLLVTLFHQNSDMGSGRDKCNQSVRDQSSEFSLNLQILEMRKCLFFFNPCLPFFVRIQHGKGTGYTSHVLHGQGKKGHTPASIKLEEIGNTISSFGTSAFCLIRKKGLKWREK